MDYELSGHPINTLRWTLNLAPLGPTYTTWTIIINLVVTPLDILHVHGL